MQGSAGSLILGKSPILNGNVDTIQNFSGLANQFNSNNSYQQQEEQKEGKISIGKMTNLQRFVLMNKNSVKLYPKDTEKMSKSPVYSP